MVLRILVVLLLALAGAIAAPASVACACSCAVLDTDEALANASAVFDGEVVATSQPTGGSSAELIEYTIEVTRVYKGSVPARVVVRSAVDGASCGIELVRNVTVFASGPVDDLRTTICDAPVTLDRAKLGTGYAPEPVATPTPESPTTSAFTLAPLILGTLAGVLVLGGVVFWMVRRPRG